MNPSTKKYLTRLCCSNKTRIRDFFRSDLDKNLKFIKEELKISLINVIDDQVNFLTEENSLERFPSFRQYQSDRKHEAQLGYFIYLRIDALILTFIL